MAEEFKFQRTELLVGTEVMKRISEIRVILFGLGGVGSWCAESLIRSGVRHLTIVDSDWVSETNINRQLPATTITVGQAKADVLQARLTEINPDAQITAIQGMYNAETAESFRLDTYDYILDAIDSVKEKIHLIQRATQTRAVFFSSMGAALKINPSRIRTAEFWKVNGCRLAAALRRKLRKNEHPSKKFICVFSDEALENKKRLDELDTVASDWDKRQAHINGSIAHITAIFGFTLASLVIQDIHASPNLS